jgi:hypothetical protein
MVDPRMTMFKAMILYEQETIIEKLAQGALRAREEMIATEESKISLVSPIQERNFPMTQDTWERGLLMMEQEKKIMD